MRRFPSNASGSLRPVAAAACVAAAATLFLEPAPSHAQMVRFDPIAEVAAKIAEALASANYKVVAVEAADARLRDAIVTHVRARGVAVERSAPAKVYASCGRNLREGGCTAEIVAGDAVQLVSALQLRDAGVDTAALALALRFEELVAQREPMLDVAPIGELLLVLEPRRVTLRPRPELSGEFPTPLASAPLPQDRVWPRDMRGRLRVTDAGFEVFLPAASCLGRVKPLSIACAGSEAGWPLGIDNAGMVGNRNYFVTPEGFAFYGAAPLGDGRAERWLVADRDGGLAFLDANRSVARRDQAADDVVRVTQPCAEGVHVVAAGPARDGSRADELRLLRVTDAALTPVASSGVAGTVTALWAEPGDRAARAVVRSPTLDRYEAFRVTIACAR